MSNDEKDEQGLAELAATGSEAGRLDPQGLRSLLGDVPLELAVELGRITMNLDQLAARLGPGSIIPLNKMAGDKLDVRVNGRLIARAEAVAVGDRCGVRIVQVVRPAEGDLS